MLAHDMAATRGGVFLLRIEDIDQSRARPEWEAQIDDDLHWLGLSWPTPVMRQSERMQAYHAALGRLGEMGLTYACTCRRRDIEAAANAPQEGGAAIMGPDGLVYPGTCRHAGLAQTDAALRLDMRKALPLCGPLPGFHETGAAHAGHVQPDPDWLVNNVGDIVLARRDMGTSYHLSVVVDDAAQGITHVVRGADLFESTAIHLVLQRLLNLPTPIYHHHRLIRDETGKRLAKRDDARAIAKFRNDGATPDDIRKLVGL